MALITSQDIYAARPVPGDAPDKGGSAARKSPKRQPAGSAPVRARAKSKPSTKPIARRKHARAKS